MMLQWYRYAVIWISSIVHMQCFRYAVLQFYNSLVLQTYLQTDRAAIRGPSGPKKIELDTIYQTKCLYFVLETF